MHDRRQSSMVLYIISDETAPNFVIRTAFQNHFHPCYDFDWKAVSSGIGLRAMHAEFVRLLQQQRPEYCFMQVQNPGAMDVQTVREMARYTKIIHWTGDVRNSKVWYDWLDDIGREVYLTLFSNETDVHKMRARGIQGDYLQIGFDQVYYQRRSGIAGWPAIVFVANDYDQFDLSAYRAETVRIMYEAFPYDFRVFGSGWERRGIVTESLGHTMEAECYNSCRLALSVSSFCYDRYYSDRLLRIMACGCCAVSHSFPGLDKDFTPGTSLVSFRDHQDLIEVCRYYLGHDDERRRIGENALAVAQSKCTWDVRCGELMQLLEQYG